MTLMQRIVARPIGAVVIATAVAILGMLAWQRLSVALLPEVESPIITVRVDRSGASAQELEEQLLIPLQDLLATLPGLQGMQGQANDEAVEVRLALSADGNMEHSLERLRERLASWRRPRGTSEPRVLRYDPSGEPLLRLLVRARPDGPDLEALALAAREDLLPRLEGRPSVATALIRGGSDVEMRIQPRMAAVQAAGLDMDDIADAIRDGVDSRSVGHIRTADGSRTVNLRGPVTLPEHLHELPLPGGHTLGDIADIDWQRSEDDERIISFGNQGSQPAVVLEIMMQAQAAIVAASDDIQHSLDQLATPTEHPGQWHFHGGDLILLADRAAPIRTALAEVIQAMIMGSILAGFVLLLFLRSWWSATVVFLSLPLSVSGAFLVLSQLGIGINLMSLGGLALGIGMLVDNAIVVIESARRHTRSDDSIERRRSLVSAGCSDIAPAVVAATATTVAVFLPLIFAPGIIGDLLLDLAWAVAASLSASLAVALIVTPPLLALGGPGGRKKRAQMPSVHAGYDLRIDIRDRRWWLAQLATLSPLIALIWQAPLGHIMLSMGAIWMLSTSVWLWRQVRPHTAAWRCMLGLPLRWSNVLLCTLRWWLVALLMIPLMLLLRVMRVTGSILTPFTAPLRRTSDHLGASTARIYERTLQGIVSHPWRAVALGLVVMASGAACAPWLPVRLLPETTHQSFVMDISLPRATSLEDGQTWAADFLDQVTDTQPGLMGMTLIGEDHRFAPTLQRRQAHQQRMVIVRSRAADNVEQEYAWLAAMEQRALAAGALAAAAWAPPLVDLTGTQGQSFAIALQGGDPEILDHIAQQWMGELRLLGARGVRSSAHDRSRDLHIYGDAIRLQEAGLSWQQVVDALRGASALHSIESFRPRYDGHTPSATTLPIRVHAPLREASLSDLASFNLGDSQRPIPLSAVAELSLQDASGAIYHRDGQRVSTLLATALPQGWDGAAMISALQRTIPLPADVTVIDFGLSSIDAGHVQALLGLLALAVFLVLVVMAVQFEDLAQPLLVLIAVPMALIGAVPALAISGHGIDVMSGIGIIVLAGIAVNNAIVLVSTANNRRRDATGLAILEMQEAVRIAAGERLRPIAMTTLTTVLALLPLAIGWGEASALRGPLAVAVIGGLISSAVLVLLVLPGIMVLCSRSAGVCTPKHGPK
ncbi:MAG: efflux RND transporter permease subunit [Planctomycetota bacterium]|nr:MAG: efflux RND transporter permease subunit [Planctomycetota bacterium]